MQIFDVSNFTGSWQCVSDKLKKDGKHDEGELFRFVILIHFYEILVITTLILYTEAKEMKSPVSSPRTNEFSLNGSIKSTSTLPNHSDVIENIASSNASQQDKSSHGDHPKNTNVEMEAKGNELEMAANVENQDNVQDANVPEPYVHSLLKWPSGRTWVTKV